MRAALLAGSLVVAFALPAFAQMSPGQQGGQGNFAQQGQPGQPGQPGEIRRGQEGMGGAMGMMAGRGGPERMEAMMRLAGALSSGTFYRFRRGDDEVDIHCPPSQSLQDCVTGAVQLMRMLQQTGSAGGAPAR